jgi:hypothetical protein
MKAEKDQPETTKETEMKIRTTEELAQCNHRPIASKTVGGLTWHGEMYFPGEGHHSITVYSVKDPNGTTHQVRSVTATAPRRLTPIRVWVVTPDTVKPGLLSHQNCYPSASSAMWACYHE